MTDWISVDDKLPKSGQRVLFFWMNDYNPPRPRISIGFYAAQKSISADEYEEPQEYEYDEEKDCYWLGEGWYEEGAEGEYFYGQKTPTHWMPLPPPPKE